MHYLPEDSLQALKTLYLKNDQKGMITLNNSRKLGKLVFVEEVYPVPLLNHYVSLTEDGKEFCEKKWGAISLK